MELTKKQLKIKYLVYCLLIILAALVQNVSGLWFEIGGSHCFFLIPVTIILGITEDERIAALLGLFGGLLWDTVSAQHMGFNFVFLMLICYITSRLETFFIRSTFWVQCVSSAVGALLYSVTYWLLFVVTKGSDGSGMSLWYFYVPSAVYTGVMGVVICAVLGYIKNKLNHETVVKE